MAKGIFWIGLVAGFLIARHFIGPMFAKGIKGDVNVYLQHNPQFASGFRQQLSPQQLAQARQQGFNL